MPNTSSLKLKLKRLKKRLVSRLLMRKEGSYSNSRRSKSRTEFVNERLSDCYSKPKRSKISHVDRLTKMRRGDFLRF